MSLAATLAAYVFQSSPILNATVPMPQSFRSLLKKAETPGVYEDNHYAGIYNRHTGLLFDKKSGNLAGIWDRKGWTSASNLDARGNPLCPLWQAEIMLPEGEKPLSADSNAAPLPKILILSNGVSATAKLVWQGVPIGGYQIPVEAKASLTAEDSGIRWGISIPGNQQKRFSIWSISYPIVAVPAFDSGGNNRLVLPVRRGVLRPYGPNEPRAAIPLPYPGPSAKFQFMAAYGTVSRKGLYFAADDGEGYSKVFHYANEPGAGVVILKTEHLPSDRGIPGTGFASPYEITTAPFQGDWWTAARIYRNWWIRQIWASKGLLQDRGDVPDWIKKAPICLRFSTTKPERTIEINVSTGTAISNLLNKTPFFGIWYGPFGENLGQIEEGLDELGHGHLRPVSGKVQEALKTMSDRHVYFLAYIQSMIYDVRVPNVSAEEAKLAKASVIRDRKGHIAYYGSYPPESGKYAMDRGSDWWQERLVEQSREAIKSGFRGIYLDSFGKGEPENFTAARGQAVGGGNRGIAGQRKMARRITEAVRDMDKEAVLAGEDPIEAFRDLIHVNLYAVNSYEGYVPIYRTVWGDYSLGHGRNIRMSEDTTADIAEMARLFVDGDILGRFFCDGGSRMWTNPKERAEQKQYIQKASNFTARAIDWLRFGEYLHPLDLNVPLVEYAESVGANKTTAPTVLNSVTRSHRDGSIGIVFTNISDSPITFNIDFSSLEVGKLPETLSKMNEQGDLKVVEEGAAGTHSVTIKPRDILFYILK